MRYVLPTIWHRSSASLTLIQEFNRVYNSILYSPTMSLKMLKQVYIVDLDIRWQRPPVKTLEHASPKWQPVWFRIACAPYILLLMRPKLLKSFQSLDLRACLALPEWWIGKPPRASEPHSYICRLQYAAYIFSNHRCEDGHCIQFRFKDRIRKKVKKKGNLQCPKQKQKLKKGRNT